MADDKKPKPAPKTRYGPTFDEIERRDPVQWHAAHKAWVSDVILFLSFNMCGDQGNQRKVWEFLNFCQSQGNIILHFNPHESKLLKFYLYDIVFVEF